MVTSDIMFVIKWWLMFFVIGLIFLPLTTRIFSNFFDKGYIFSKIIGIALISYIVFLLGILKILPFTHVTIIFTIIIFLIFNIILIKRLRHSGKPKAHRESDSRQASMTSLNWKIFLFEESLFLCALFFWSYIRAHQPDIHGLEKYEDFGFINSIMRSEYFPPRDMWFTPFSINYYYFGHLVTAVLTKLSFIPSLITFNLMLATIFAFTFTGAFSIGLNLFNTFLATTETQKKREAQKNAFSFSRILSASVIVGLLSGFLATMAGNLHTIYTFFKPYVNENPVAFWQLAFSPGTFPNSYWYPNATRFIHNTIHEYPLYSFVVSDLHAHVLDMPFVLLTIALLLSILISKSFNILKALLLSFLLAVMYMTNAWDGAIYFVLTALVIAYFIFKPSTYRILSRIQNYNFKSKIILWLFYVGVIGITFVMFSLPFNLHFKPFASGIGILCAPEFLTNIGKLGPLIFEKDHCQHSPWWQLSILYGFFYFWVLSFLIFLIKRKNHKSKITNHKQISNFNILNSKRFGFLNFKNWNLFGAWNFEFGILTSSDFFVLILIFISTLLIIIPEFIYVKDIYPGHYRANTMFKLVYQSFIMLSISSGYIIIRLFLNLKSLIINRNLSYWKLGYWVIGIIGLFLVSLYPYFAINAYYDNLKTYKGLDGTTYLKTVYPTDYSAILWINKNIKGQPIILEAQGDSYTDYARVSSNTGLPTVLGWTVHEWLWRGTYDIPSPRIPEVQKMYESEDLEETKNLLKKHKVELVFFGDLERQKYPNLNEDKFKSFGKVIYKNEDTKIYKIK